MQKFLLLTVLSLLSYITINAQTPFAGCGDAFYLLSGPGGQSPQPITLHSIDTTSLAATAFGSTVPLHIDGAGYNQVDNLIYGMSDENNDGTPDLHLIDATGAQTQIAVVNPPAVGAGDFGSAVLWGVGDVDQSGVYHFPAVIIRDIVTEDYDIYLGKIDLTGSLASPIMPTYSLITTAAGGCQPLIDPFVSALVAYYLGGSTGPQPDGGIQDWAFNPLDGLLYSYLGVEGYVFELSSAGEATCHDATGNGSLNQFGAIFFDRSGDMNGYNSVTGNSYTIDYSSCPSAACGTLTAGTSHTANQRLDAVSCPWPLPVVLTPMPFDDCGVAYISQATFNGGSAAPTTLSTLDTMTLAATQFGNSIPLGMNAIGFNQVDKFLYGMNDLDDNGSPELYQIGNDGAYLNMGSISLPVIGPGAFGAAILWTVGDVDAAGNYYFPAVVVNNISPPDYDLYLGRIDLNVPIVAPILPVYTPILTAAGGCQPFVDTYVNALVAYYLGGSTGPQPDGGIQDWAFNPNDGLLYAYLGVEAAVFTFDTGSGVASCFPTGAASLGQFGGIFFDTSADMYGIESTTGIVYTIDISGGCPTAPCGDLTAGPSIGQANMDAAGNFDPSCVPLPLELTHFAGRKDRFDVILDWTTNYEENVKSFIVEKSANGFDFTTLGDVRAVGNSTGENNYQFKDENPNPGLNYYRLSFLDFDGQYEVYQHLVVIDMEKGSLYFTVNPNPTSDKIRVEMTSTYDKELQVEIFDVTGKLMLETIIAPKQFFKEIDVEHFSPGLYLLKAKSGIQGYVQRFVKQ